MSRPQAVLDLPPHLESDDPPFECIERANRDRRFGADRKPPGVRPIVNTTRREAFRRPPGGPGYRAEMNAARLPNRDFDSRRVDVAGPQSDPQAIDRFQPTGYPDIVRIVIQNRGGLIIRVNVAVPVHQPVFPVFAGRP